MKDRDRRKEPLTRDPKGSAGTPDATTVPVVPLKPRRGLFIALFLLFLTWVGALLTMWFFTIHRKN
jgi:hypothetical protein